MLPLPCWSLPLNPERARPGNSLAWKGVIVTVCMHEGLEGIGEGVAAEIRFANGTIINAGTIHCKQDIVQDWADCRVMQSRTPKKL